MLVLTDIDVLVDHFTNTSVYALVIADIIDRTDGMLQWNQHVILYLNKMNKSAQDL